METLAKKKKP